MPSQRYAVTSLSYDPHPATPQTDFNVLSMTSWPSTECCIREKREHSVLLSPQSLGQRGQKRSNIPVLLRMRFDWFSKVVFMFTEICVRFLLLWFAVVGTTWSATLKKRLALPLRIKCSTDRCVSWKARLLLFVETKTHDGNLRVRCFSVGRLMLLLPLLLCWWIVVRRRKKKIFSLLGQWWCTIPVEIDKSCTWVHQRTNNQWLGVFAMNDRDNKKSSGRCTIWVVTQK